MALLVCFSAAVAAAPAGAASGDWLQLGRTAAHPNRVHDGALGRDRLGSLHVAFAGHYGDNTTTQAGAVVAGDTPYTPGADGDVSAFSLGGCGAAVCEPLWRGHTDNDITNTPAIGEGVLVV